MEQKDIPDYPLSDEEIKELNKVIRSNEPHHVRNAAQGILYLFRDHYTYELVATILNVHPNTARNWAYYGITSLRIAIRDIIRSFGSTYIIQFSS